MPNPEDVVLQAIKIAGEASYSVAGESLDNLKALNFVFGTNGAGKTTISRVIGDPDTYPTCALSWNNGQKIDCLVYNSNFVSKNFAPQLPGIFTLGETESDTLSKIEAAKIKVTQFRDGVGQLESTLGPVDGSSGKRADLKKLRAEFETECWKIKTKQDAHFKDAFAGLRNSQSKFCDKVLAEAAGNTSALAPLEELKRKATTLFVQGLERHAPINVINMNDLMAVETDVILSKKVVGKEDVDVAALIRRLGNSDWVRQGLGFLDHGSQCPFCQQDVDDELADRLNAYFDETYLRDMADITKALESYRVHSEDVLQRLEQILALESRHIDAVKLRADIDRLAARIGVNKRLLDAKKKEPSAPVSLESLSEIAEAITAQIDGANKAITSHNALVDNLAAERSALISQIWKFLIDESTALIQKHAGDKSGLDRAVAGLSASITSRQAQLTAAQLELRELERSVTSVQPTVNEINALLASFGFSGFKLRTAGERDHLYEIVRDSGDNAAATLSEGEKSFVSFLYFYHLLRGSVSETGVTSDRIVVFDDPVSSLDSDVLFIVSALIKRVLKEACEETGQIKQVFVLTHNIYFHKEVSFDPKRGVECRAHETFWIVRKLEGASKIVSYKYNPIKTSYELLWAEVRNPNRSNMTIQNTLRRIVENYFKILGNVDTDTIVAQFSGKDQQVCSSLFSWVNDGSHSTHDDFYVSVDDGIVARYLDVFRRIFEKTGHHAHYAMMIGPEPIAEGPVSVAPALAEALPASAVG